VRLLTSQLFGVAPRDPITLTAAAALIAFCVVAAGVRPARRAARVDAVKVLRE
jgi:ABC-type lipoprotein release transport system permease subunit